MTANARNVGPSGPFAVDFAAGELIFEEGDLGTEMYVIQEGRVEIFRHVRGEEKRVALLEKGDFFGEMAILEELPRNASARALEPTRMLEVNGATFGQMLLETPEIAIRMMRKLSHRLRRAAERFGTADDPNGLAALDVPPAAPLDEEKTRVMASQHLFCEATGEKLFLSAGAESTIGRRDPVTGIDPDIDLTPVDHQRSTSRRHAKIHRRGGRYYLIEEIGTTNGTFIGETRLRTGAPLEIEHGDRLRFGLVPLVFRAHS